MNALAQRSVRLATDYMAIAPEPAARNADVSKVYEAQQQVQPSFSDVCTGLLTGQIKTSVTKAMKGVQDSYDKSLDDAIKLVNQRGGKVSRDDFVFSDWNPREPYTKLYGS